MGIEYELRVPEAARGTVAITIATELPSLLERLDPRAREAFPNLYVEQIPEGLYVCDNLTDSKIAALVIRALIDLLLKHSPAVSVVEA